MADKEKCNQAMVVMPTVPGRESFASKVILSFLNQNVGKIIVLLNGHERKSLDILPKDSRIVYVFNKPGTGPISRFYAIKRSNYLNFNYVFTVDDDINYPPNYVSENIKLVDQFGRNYIITYHAHYWTKNKPDYRLRTTYRIDRKSSEFGAFPFGGSGASVFSRHIFSKIQVSKVPKGLFEYNDDIWLSAFAKTEGLRFLRPPTGGSWITIQRPHPVKTLYNSEIKSNFKRRNNKLKYVMKKYGLNLTERGRVVEEANYDFFIYIKTYNRKDNLLKLLKDIRKNQKSFNIKVKVFNDSSSEDYTAVKSLLDKYGWEYIRFRKNHGKKEAWKVSNAIYSDVKTRKSKFYMVFPDDIRLCKNFFELAIKNWKSISDKEKVSMVLIRDSGRDKGAGPGPCWTGEVPRQVSGGNWKTGWVDELFMAEKKYFSLLNYSIEAVPLTRFKKNPNISSGVGRGISLRLHKMGAGMYCVDKSLAVFVNCDSKMNPEEREKNPLKTLNFIMGEKHKRVLENE